MGKSTSLFSLWAVFHKLEPIQVSLDSLLDLSVLCEAGICFSNSPLRTLREDATTLSCYVEAIFFFFGAVDPHESRYIESGSLWYQPFRYCDFS